MSKRQDWPVPDSDGYRMLTGSLLTKSDLNLPLSTWGLFLKDVTRREPLPIAQLTKLIELRCERSLPAVVPIHDRLHRLRLRYELVAAPLEFHELEYLDAIRCDIDLTWIARGCPKLHSLHFYECNVKASASWAADRVQIDNQRNEDWEWLRLA